MVVGDDPQGLKPRSFLGIVSARLKLPQRRRPGAGDPGKSCPDTKRICEKRCSWLRKKALSPGKSLESVPQGLKPALIRLVFIPGMNPRPTARMSFSPSCKVVP